MPAPATTTQVRSSRCSWSYTPGPHRHMPPAFPPQRKATTVRTCSGPHTLSSYPSPDARLCKLRWAPCGSTGAGSPDNTSVVATTHGTAVHATRRQARPTRPHGCAANKQSHILTCIQQTYTQTVSCHINPTDTRVSSQSGSEPANTSYALPPTRLITCSPKVSLGLLCSSPCTLSDPDGPVSCQVLCRPYRPCPHSQTPAFPSADGFALDWEQS